MEIARPLRGKPDQAHLTVRTEPRQATVNWRECSVELALAQETAANNFKVKDILGRTWTAGPDMEEQLQGFGISIMSFLKGKVVWYRVEDLTVGRRVGDAAIIGAIRRRATNLFEVEGYAGERSTALISSLHHAKELLEEAFGVPSDDLVIELDLAPLGEWLVLDRMTGELGIDVPQSLIESRLRRL